MINLIYHWLPIVFGCHCMDSRSFHFRGKKFPICARCTGELVGILFSLFSCLFFRLSVIISILLLLPMVIDGFVQMFTYYESNNCRRFITGVMFGYGLFMLFAISTIATFKFGMRIAIKIK